MWYSQGIPFIFLQCVANLSPHFESDVDSTPPAPGPAPVPAASCTDEPDAYMQKKEKTCKTFTWGIKNKCNDDSQWTANTICQQSCFDAGKGYTDDDCSSGGSGNCPYVLLFDDR